MSSATGSIKYVSLSRDELIARLAALEGATPDGASHTTAHAGSSSISLHSPSSSVQVPSDTGRAARTPKPKPKSKPKPVKAPKPFNFASHPTRHIALLIAYHGWPYSGLAIQGDAGAVGAKEAVLTVEGELEKALEKTRLIEPGKGLEGARYSRCGRTDRGVSGEGQVVDLWVRSGRGEGVDGDGARIAAWEGAREVRARDEGEVGEGTTMQEDNDAERSGASAPTSKSLNEAKVPHASQGKAKKPKPTPPPAPSIEHHYTRLLNNVLPPSIRILAWSPASPTFDSRFSCAYRHYKYIFHLRPTPSTPPLDLARMARAAQRLVGEHDYRNYCKLDGAKQILSHKRTVLRAYFELEPALSPAAAATAVQAAGVADGLMHGQHDGIDDPPAVSDGVYVFNLIGTAFLWHQVRHIIAALFLVGARLEPEHVISDLLDVDRFPSKPTYQMGDPLPLTLHECGYGGRVGTLGSRDGGPEEDNAMAIPEAEAEAELENAGLVWRYGPYDGLCPPPTSDPAARSLKRVDDGREALGRGLEAQSQEAELRAWQVRGAQRVVRRVLGEVAPPELGPETPPQTSEGIVFPTGGGQVVLTAKYKPVVERPRGETPDEVNRKWRDKVGAKGDVKGQLARILARQAGPGAGGEGEGEE